MAGRIRTIKPELLDDEKAAALSDAAWRLFVSSWLLADDHGRFRAGQRYLAAQVWQDTSKAKVAEEALGELARAGRVRVYQVDGDTYAEIPTWARHQRVDNAGRPRVPAPGPNDYVELAAVSRRLAETLGGSPLEPPQPAALPPTSDLRPPTSDPDHTPARTREGAAVAAQLPEESQDLLTIAQQLAAEGNPFGQSVVDRAAQGRLPTPNQRDRLRAIRQEQTLARGALSAAMHAPPTNGHAQARDGPHYVYAEDLPEPPPMTPEQKRDADEARLRAREKIQAMGRKATDET